MSRRAIHEFRENTLHNNKVVSLSFNSAVVSDIDNTAAVIYRKAIGDPLYALDILRVMYNALRKKLLT